MNPSITIVGRGMVASSFVKAHIKPTIPATIFASGVSDSACCDEAKFLREKNLLELQLRSRHESGYFVYFGTCSIYDQSINSSPYVIHKRRMEDIVLSSAIGRVIRLPQVVGPNAPATTLVPYLVSCIKTETPFCVWTKAFRNIIHVDHIVAIVLQLLSCELADHKVMNVACPYGISVPDLVSIIEGLLMTKGRYSLVDRYSSYNIDVHSMLDAASRAGVLFGSDYYQRVVSCYVSGEFAG